MGSLGSELGVVDAGFFLGLRNPLNVSASCLNTFFLGDVVLLEVVFGVALLPSSVTSPSVGPEFDSGDTGAWVGDVPEPDVSAAAPGLCPALAAPGLWPRRGGSLSTSDSCGSWGSVLALIAGEFVGAIVGVTGAGIDVGSDSTPVTKLFAPCPIAPGSLAMVSMILSAV